MRGGHYRRDLLAKPVLLLVTLLLAGCGAGDEQGGSDSSLPRSGGGGSLSWALPALPVSLDPLAADRREAQLVSRQIHEPLVATVSPPYEDDPRPSGLALSLKPSSDRTVWTVVLRSGVRFQDGSPFNADAVLANSRRWSTLPAGSRLLPGLFAVDAPHPHEIRFQLDRPVADLPRLLGDPRLGIVSPQALDPPSGEGARFRDRAPGSGTGAFELRTRDSAEVELTRSASWWGAAAGLGPALDTVAFLAAPRAAERLELLRSGEAQVIEPLDGAAAAAVAADALLVDARVSGVRVGIEASVRGLGGGSAVPALSGVWLTRLAD